ncbi:MAG TPA: DUF3426 domain-containing protein, partial [Gammaproteobacteria bacterium]|nr:DUF3426 domain-containing protein [Gammaproteobacteria bacterium]
AETIDPPEHAAADPDAPDAEQQALPALRESHPGEPTSSAPLPADPQPIAATRWRPLERGEPESPGWRLAAALAAGALLLQGAHHFRASLAHVPYLGTAVERLYSLTGQPIENFGDPQDFSIVEWAATAQESDAAQPGILEITAGVRNESDAPRRYPMLSLELTDRWQTVIGARVFVPEEYLDTGVSQNALIRPNSTVTAHLSLIDPGPEAYGFEVDVCVAADAGRIRCKSDLLFE